MVSFSRDQERDGGAGGLKFTSAPTTLKLSPGITATALKLIFENRRNYGESAYPFEAG
jgi:hypothetical protein